MTKFLISKTIVCITVLIASISLAEQAEKDYIKQILPDDAVHGGHFKDGLLFSGHGTLTWQSGNKYEGDFKDGLMHGRGVITWTDGNKYEGDFKFGLMHGKGVRVYSNGDIYEGQFKNGLPDGKGKYIQTNGKIIDGFWVEGAYLDSDETGLMDNG